MKRDGRLNFYSIFIIAIGLGMDALSVAIGVGAAGAEDLRGAGPAHVAELRPLPVFHAADRLGGGEDGGRLDLPL